MTNLNGLISDIIRAHFTSKIYHLAISRTLGQTVSDVFQKLGGFRHWTVSDLQVLHSEYGIEFPISALAGAR